MKIFLKKSLLLRFSLIESGFFSQKTRIVSEIKGIPGTKNLNLNSLTTKPSAIKYKSS